MVRIIKEISSGSSAAAFTASLFSPLELIKTRLQVQEDPQFRGNRPYQSGFLKALRKVAIEDGVFLLWRHGFICFVGRDFLYSGIKIGTYPTVRQFFAKSDAQKEDISLLTKIVASLCTGGVGSGLANPLDVVRVRMSVEGGRLDRKTGMLVTGMRAGQPPQYRNSLHCFAKIYQMEGITNGLWKGTTATISRAALISSGSLASYDHSKILIRQAGWMEEGPTLHATCAVISGLVAVTACNPADVVKSRIMIASTGAAQASISRIILQIWSQEGLTGFMRGWFPAYCRIGPAYFIEMPIVEHLRSLFGLDAI
eukprot:gnl/MRDRNA2_/MRDRNA2_183231_c0_seq1.p1 gnl/MRDRNA2_/MRDRNA2_183231_c0~~gnl/MRDRNA2_/MRDRNA2_183231_c0_seq1.p1  ORF type:complete len:312 (+),score=37.50 gnl/MRDRNA2_/MRDRNA2_183231_c0_seq1:79-1014(+)